MHLHFLIAANWFLDPITHALEYVITSINHVTHSFGWSMVALAALVTLVLWPLRHMQFKSMAEMQALAPHVSELRTKHKGDPQKLNQETMALYKEHGVNPLAGCFPLLLQMPILFSLYWAIISNQQLFNSEGWLWIGGDVSHRLPQVFATSLAAPDMVLLGLYVISMYFTVRFGSPASPDPAQAKQQQIMAFVSPLMIAFIGRSWPSALILYWLMSNVFSTAQQLYLMNMLKKKIVVPPLPSSVTATAKIKGPKNVTPATNGSTSSARKKRSRR